jgi:hypothetical protein
MVVVGVGNFTSGIAIIGLMAAAASNPAAEPPSIFSILRRE